MPPAGQHGGVCGRVIITTPVSAIARLLRADALVADTALSPSWNVAPTRLLPVAYEVLDAEGVASQRAVDLFRWGLVPPWARDLAVGRRLFNARAETAAAKPAFRQSFATRRCLVMIDAFYEWHTENGRRQPYRVFRRDEKPLALAGLWEIWEPRAPGAPGAAGAGSPRAGDAGSALRTCTIITKASSGAVAALHDRMPAILDPPEWDAWLDPRAHELARIESLLDLAGADDLDVHPVGQAVGSVANDGPELARPAPVSDVPPSSHRGPPPRQAHR